MVEPHKYDVVGICGGVPHAFGYFGKLMQLCFGCTLCCPSRHETLELAPDLQQPELDPKIDFRNEDTATRQDIDQTIPRKPLQCLTNGGASNTQPLSECGLRQHGTRGQLQRHNLLFELRVSHIG